MKASLVVIAALLCAGAASAVQVGAFRSLGFLLRVLTDMFHMNAPVKLDSFSEGVHVAPVYFFECSMCLFHCAVRSSCVASLVISARR